MPAVPPPEQLSLFVASERSPRLAEPSTEGTGKRRSSATELPAEAPARATLQARLNRLLGGRLAELVLTRNRERILSVRPAGTGGAALVLRLDAGFAVASEEVLAAVAAWVDGDRRSRRRALAVIRRHFAAGHRAEPAPRRPPALAPAGRTLDLRELLAELDREHFADRLGVDVTWGRALPRRRRRRRSIRLGSYCYETRVIRIHRALDHPSVPRYVVAAVLFHEMLHAALPPPPGGGARRCLHPPEHRRREATFPDHGRAQRWLARHLHSLLRRHG